MENQNISLNKVRNAGKPVPWCLGNKMVLKMLGERKLGKGDGGIQVDILSITRIKVESVWSSNTLFLKELLIYLKSENVDTTFYVFFFHFFITFHL